MNRNAAKPAFPGGPGVGGFQLAAFDLLFKY
jgi:hypothetical protein